MFDTKDSIMEEALLLRDLGVDQELEGTVLSRFFASKGLPEEAAHPHPQTQNLTQAVLEGTVVDEEAQGDDHRPSTCKTILLPEEWKKSRAETSTSGVLYGKLTNPFDHDIPSNEEVEFLEAVCPHCNSTFLFPRDEVDERLATHISRCESQRLRRKARNKCNYSAFDNEETESLADSSEEDRPSKRRPRKSTGLKPARRQVDIEVQRSSSPIEVESDSSVVDVDGYSNKIDPMACQDDWEERDYERRLSLLSAADLRTIETPFGGILYAHTWERLHEYQRQGCEWLHNLYREGAGGILADEMGKPIAFRRIILALTYLASTCIGLGKTAQACAHFGSLGGLSSRLYRSGNAATLIACPATVLQHWLNEMHRWAPGVRVGVLHSISKTGKELSSLKAKGIAVESIANACPQLPCECYRSCLRSEILSSRRQKASWCRYYHHL